MDNYQLPPDKLHKEDKLIQQIVRNNGYDTPIGKITCNNHKHKRGIAKIQWFKFTYVGKETRAITKVSKNTKIRVTYSTNNSPRKPLTKTPPTQEQI
jgi:uncharacterized lipoprotein YddW (UPF0748 family)